MKLSMHYNANCSVCVRRAMRTSRLDWLSRIELRTDDSPLGAVPPGEIVVVEQHGNRVFTGMDAVRKVCLQIPLLLPYGLVLGLSPARRPPGGRGETYRDESADGGRRIRTP